jgi:UDP-3-O-[3-hydroxymyristoyl] glucosamine N-acyltransferase
MIWKPPKIEHGKPNQYGWVVWHPEHFLLGENTDIGWGCFIQAEYGVVIGEGTKLGAYCIIYSADTENQKNGIVSIGNNTRIGAGTKLYPNTYIGSDVFIKAGCTIAGAKIGRNSVIGVDSLILPGVTIENGAKIPAKSIVK